MTETIELQGDGAWIATNEMKPLGELVRMEIAKHIWDSRHNSMVTGFEYARKRGTRNMLLSTPPVLDAPRGKSQVAAAWDVESLQVEVTCQGRDEGDDQIVVLLSVDGAAPVKFQCGLDGELRMREGHLTTDRVPDEIDGPAAPASAKVTSDRDQWSAHLRIPWSMLGIRRPLPSSELLFNVVRLKDWADVVPPEMLPGGMLVNGNLEPVAAGLEVSTLSTDVRYPIVSDPMKPERAGRLILSPPLAVEALRLSDLGCTRKQLALTLNPTVDLPPSVDVRIRLTDPYGRVVSTLTTVPSSGPSALELPYVFGSYRGIFHPYRLKLLFSHADTGMALASRRCSFIPASRVRVDPLERDHEQRGAGRFRLEGKGIEATTWHLFLVDNAQREWDRGVLIPTSEVEVFTLQIGELPRGRYRLRLRPEGLDAACYVECPCTVLGIQARPTVLLSPAALDRMRREVRRGGLRPHYEEIRRRVDLAMERGTITETSWTPTGLEPREILIDDAFLAGDELLHQGSADDTLFVRDPHLMMEAAVLYLIDGKREYGLFAKRLLQVLVDHVIWGDARSYGHANSHKPTPCALILDWLPELFSADERRILRDSLVENMLSYYLWSMETNPLRLKGEIGNSTSNEDHGAVLVALALRDEVMDAEEVLAAAREDIQTPLRAIPPDGSWPESVNYWGAFFHPIITYAQALETATGTDDGVFSLPGIRNAGYFPIYFTPRGVPAGFGDAGWAAAADPFLHLLARKYDEPLFSLYADAYGGTPIDEYSYYRHSDWYTLLWRSPEYEYLDAVQPTEIGDLPPPPALAAHMKLDTLKVYEEIRWAAVASSWPVPELYVSFKSGYAIRGFGHTCLDLNAIQVVAGGELLITRSHDYGTPGDGYSTLMIDGKTQRPATGTFIYRDETERYKVIAAEADRSFEAPVSKVRRHVIMVDGRYVVILDEVEAEAPVRVTFMAHTPGQLHVDDDRVRIQGVRSSLLLATASPKAALTTPPSPLGYRKRLADQVLHATVPPDRQIELVTVIWPDEKGADAPRCFWESQRLTVHRPDSVVDVLLFRLSGDGLQFQGVASE